MGSPFERPGGESLDIDLMFDRAKEVLAEAQINIDAFEHAGEPYSPEEVQRDKQYVEKRESGFAARDAKENSDMRKLAEILEAIIIEQGELADWFGPNAMTVKTSKLDDIANGVDMVIEFNQEDDEASHLGLATDMTLTADTTEKFDRLKSQIEDGHLAKVRYFESPTTGEKKPLEEIPEVIIGTDRNTIRQLSEDWIEGNKKALAQHKVQIMILKQIEAQLETFMTYAESLGKTDLVSIYSSRLEIIRNILNDKAVLAREVEYDITNDTVHASMMSYLRVWNRNMANDKQTLAT